MRVSRRLDRLIAEPGFAAMPDDRGARTSSAGRRGRRRSWSRPTGPGRSKGSDLVVQLHMLPGGTPRVDSAHHRPVPERHAAGARAAAVKLESKAIDIPAGRGGLRDRRQLRASRRRRRAQRLSPRALPGESRCRAWRRCLTGNRDPAVRSGRGTSGGRISIVTRRRSSCRRARRSAMRFTYDNSDGNRRNPQRPPRRVKWGPQSTDEMGALWLEILPRRRRRVAIAEGFHRAVAAGRHRGRRNAGGRQPRRSAGAQLPGHEVSAGRARATTPWRS